MRKYAFIINKIRITNVDSWQNVASRWFNFLEWLIISAVLLLVYLKTKSLYLKIILFVSYFVFFQYLASLIGNLLLKKRWIKNSITRTIIVTSVSLIVTSLVTDLVIFIVLKIAMGTI